MTRTAQPVPVPNPRLVGLWQSDQLDLAGMVTNRRPIEEINEAVEDLQASRGLRTVLAL